MRSAKRGSLPTRRLSLVCSAFGVGADQILSVLPSPGPGIDFETVETQIICDESGRNEQIIPRTRNDAHKLIEEAMLAANVCSASTYSTYSI